MFEYSEYRRYDTHRLMCSHSRMWFVPSYNFLIRVLIANKGDVENGVLVAKEIFMKI